METKFTYRIFVNGKFINETQNYNYAYNRAFGIVLFLGLTNNFMNTESKIIIDKWSNKDNAIIITKTEKQQIKNK